VTDDALGPARSSCQGIVCGAIVLLQAVLAPSAHGQGIVCCNEAISVGGDWIGTGRVADCQEYFNSAPTAILRRMCAQRAALGCINTARCNDLPPGETEPPQRDTALPEPPDIDRDGLEQGFYGSPPAPTPSPGAPPALPRRLVYIAAWAKDDKASKTFSAWLDHAGCPLPLDQNNRMADASAAKHVVRGKVVHRDGRVRVEAEAQVRPGGAKIGPFAAETQGDDAAAVARATRAVIDQLRLVCAR
jgi:hypothetical protein